MDEQTKIKAKNKSIKKPKGAYDSNQVIQQKISKIDDVFLKMHRVNLSTRFLKMLRPLYLEMILSRKFRLRSLSGCSICRRLGIRLTTG